MFDKIQEYYLKLFTKKSETKLIVLNNLVRDAKWFLDAIVARDKPLDLQDKCDKEKLISFCEAAILAVQAVALTSEKGMNSDERKAVLDIRDTLKTISDVEVKLLKRSHEPMKKEAIKLAKEKYGDANIFSYTLAMEELEEREKHSCKCGGCD